MKTAPQTLVERYVLPPAEIEALSLQQVDAALLSLGDWPEPARQVVRRMVYAAGDLSIAPLIHFHPQAIAAGLEALRKGRPVVVDVRMVEVALDHSLAGQLGCTVHCVIATAAVAQEARMLGVPRAVVAMRAQIAELADAVVVVGNAPSALLSLLDLVDAGQVRPALIIGTPVGFVAAAESKQELTARAVPFITIEGTRGGSALAAAATNALLRLATSDRGSSSA